MKQQHCSCLQQLQNNTVTLARLSYVLIIVKIAASIRMTLHFHQAYLDTVWVCLMYVLKYEQTIGLYCATLLCFEFFGNKIWICPMFHGTNTRSYINLLYSRPPHNPCHCPFLDIQYSCHQVPFKLQVLFSHLHKYFIKSLPTLVGTVSTQFKAD